MDRGNWRGDILAFFVELLQQLHKKTKPDKLSSKSTRLAYKETFLGNMSKVYDY